MNTSLTLLKFNSKAGSKEKIIEIVSNNWKTNGKKIFETLQRDYGHEITYQAVHKMLAELADENVIEKQNNTYTLNQDWIKNNRKFFESLETKFKKYTQAKNIDPNFQGSITLEFDTYSELVVSLAELFESTILATKGDRTLIGAFKHGMWPLNFNFKDFLLLMKMLGTKVEGYPIIKHKTPFGEWIMRQYKKAGAKAVTFDETLDIENDTLVQGDCILEVFYEPEFEKYLDKKHEKIRGLEDLLKEYALTKEQQTKIRLVITKNRAIAKALKEHLLKKHFGVGA